ncbi:alpha-mannosidase [Alicyclobacillus macrosporangiidus]|uniref:alpha-mannosidase n=1 Tax=Alicyclobacillus macrosporangiidus TaxID=392015 RepID=UPI0004968E6B|nr:alpha-mannosidase [Alicyclobacillus macrosporangiidus]
MFLTEEKLTARINELARYRYRDFRPIPEFRCQVDPHGHPGARPPSGGEWGVIRTGDHWAGRDLYLWLAADVALPAEWAGKQVVGLFDFGVTGGGNNSGFESLLYVDGQPFQGVDQNHTEVLFDPSSAGRTVSLCFRLWSGLEGGGPPAPQEHKIRHAGVAWLDEDTDDLYWTARAALQTIGVLAHNRTERIALVTALDRAFREVDWSYPGSPAFYDSVRAARQTLHEQLASIRKDSGVAVRALGHTHIDVAWLWRTKHTREKAARSFSTVLRLMERFPEFVFLQTQPQLYEFLRTDYPELYQQIRARVREGRWEADGAMWLEADCNLPSGESLVRQILHGTRFLKREFGVTCRYLWLPDVFGYSWALPQILAKSGIHTFVTTKISWNQYNQLPHDTFRWRGLDGTEVLTHFITTPCPEPYYTYNGLMDAQSVQGAWDNYKDKALNQELLFAFGYGDGGGGVNREMLEMRRRLDLMPGLPRVRVGRADEFFAGLHQRVADTDQYVHTWDGELYLEYHRGTYTSQAYNKRMNRKLELLYRETEWMAAVQSLLGGDWAAYPQQALAEAWTILLRNQFHDIIPGSSIREVYEDSRAEYQQAQELASRAWREAAGTLLNDDPAAAAYTVFNSSPWVRTDLVAIPVQPETEEGRWVDHAGRELTSQRSGGMWWVKVPELPPAGFAVVRFHAGAAASPAPAQFEPTESGIRTPHYEIEWNERGQLTRLFDRTAGREVLAPGERGNVLQVFEDKPIEYDAWNIEVFYQEKMREVEDLTAVEVMEVGPLRAVVRFEWQYMNSRIRQDMVVYAHSRRIDFQTEVDWHERQQLLKVAFPVDVRATEATYDIQFGNVKRPTHWNTSWDLARFESVGHQWVDLSERGYGVSLLNDCKYGHDVKDHTIRLSLIKSAIHPDPEADQGRHEFTYALLPHAGDWCEGGTVPEAWYLNNPLTHVKGRPVVDRFSLFSVSAANVMIDAVKKAEDGDLVVLRVHEFAGARTTVSIRSDLTVRSWQECNLMEEPVGERQTGGELTFTLRPYEIKTFLVDLAGPAGSAG